MNARGFQRYLSRIAKGELGVRVFIPVGVDKMIRIILSRDGLQVSYIHEVLS